MKINLVKEHTVRSFAQKHAASISSFENWIDEIRNAEWEKPDDMKSTFSSVKLLGKSSNRVKFNVSGNDYRVICKYLFGDNVVFLFVVWIGTHAEYTDVCSKDEQYTAENFKDYI
jgi:mRNA interferase HigB